METQLGVVMPFEKSFAGNGLCELMAGAAVIRKQRRAKKNPRALTGGTGVE
jgi:hypothetical protein